MKTTICKSFDFDAAHFLPMVPIGHKCGCMHGHTYRCEIIMTGKVSERDGWFLDYAEIAVAWERIHAVVDHKLLNNITGLENPTTEVLAAWVLTRLKSSPIGHLVVKVRIYESSSTWCEVEG